MRLVAALLLIVGCAPAPKPTVPSGSLGTGTSPSSSPARPASAPARRVAITIDDLGSHPWSSEREPSERILQSLRAAGAPVAVFANCQALTAETLQLWQRAGATIGNHTNSHLSINAVDGSGSWASSAWLRDVEECHERLSNLLHERIRYFRFPFSHYGNTEDRRRVAAREFEALGYRVAHITAATSEWLLAQYYDAALGAGDSALAREVASAYVEHMLRTLEDASRVGRLKTGREIAQITLVHVNRLTMDHLDEVLAALTGRGWQFIALDEALEDPIFSLPDVQTCDCGASWLAHVNPRLKGGEEYVFGQYEQQLAARFRARVEALASR